MIISLIDIDNIKKHSYLHNNINEDKLFIAIERVQDSYIHNLLGTTLYQQLQQRKQAGTLTNTDNILINNYLLPCFVIALEKHAVASLNIDYRNLTIGSVIDSQIRPLTVDEVKFYLNVKDNELAIVEKLAIDYICNNYSCSSNDVISQSNNDINIHFI